MVYWSRGDWTSGSAGESMAVGVGEPVEQIVETPPFADFPHARAHTNKARLTFLGLPSAPPPPSRPAASGWLERGARPLQIP